MINRITESALKVPGLVLIAVLAVLGIGIFQYQRMPVDAFPDISPIMVPVFAEGHGMAPEEIERLITYPIESAMNGLPGVTQIKSTSAFGMAVIYVYFKDTTDIYFARQLVGERLSSVMAELPETDEPPGLGPISTGLGQIFLYYLDADPELVDTGGKPLDTWLRELNDWMVKFQLQTVPGVTDILSIGGHVLQYQVRVDPNALWKYGLTLEDLVDAVNANNRNVGGQFLVLGSEEHLVRGVGLVRKLKAVYRPLLARAVRFKFAVMGVAGAALVVSLALAPLLGTEFIPTLEEGSIMIGVTMAPSISLEEGTKLVMEMEREIVQLAPVDETVSRIGRPEAGSHPHPVNYAEVHIELKRLSEWESFDSKDELIEAIEAKLKPFPGVQLNFTQPIQNAFDELLSGIKAQLAIKIYGEDLDILREKAEEVRGAVKDVPGLVDLSKEQSFGQPQVQIVADREACARFGVTVSEIMEMVELAVGGEVIDSIYLNTRRFGIHMRFQEAYRSDPEAVRNILVPTSGGGVIPLSQVAEVRQVTGPIQINREKNQRRWIVQGNVRGRDLGGVVADIQERIGETVALPPGYTIEYGGQFENQQRAMKRLSLIALFGIAVQNGVVLVTYFNDLRDRGKSVAEAVAEGAELRLRPVLMTALTTVLGLFPLLLARGIGADVQRPLATVVVFGLTTSTLLTLFVIPAVYVWVEEHLQRKQA